MLALPPVHDWKAKGKVTAVGDQKWCGSCWVFSALDAIESKLLIKTNMNASAVPALNLAEQQVVSTRCETLGWMAYN